MDNNSENQNLKIIYSDCYSSDHSYSYWHGENVVEIQCEFGIFDISAIGDVRCSLYAKKDFIDKHGNKYEKNDYIASVKDKNNTGRFYDVLNSYIENDKHLLMLLLDEDDNMELDMENNNWIVLTYIDNDGNTTFIDDYDSLKIEDAINDIKRIIEYKRNHPDYDIFKDDFPKPKYDEIIL